MGKVYELNVDPRILELLGPSLYTNIYYVLAELIANAYDADAKNVYIITDKDEIRVEDDGKGMSYSGGEIKKYLNVAGITRETSEQSFTPGGRKRMGRKGVGKLAALSVSENVDVITVANGEKSGFILSRHPEGNKLTEIPDEKITFKQITEHGTAIVMRSPEYRLHKTLAAVKRNVLKIFPVVGQDFRIHLCRAGEQPVIIDDFDQSVMADLSTLVTLGGKFAPLASLVPVDFPARHNELVEVLPEKHIPITMADNEGSGHEYDLVIEGWIGTYKSTRGRKAEMTDFPDNFISLFANDKLGEFNLLPIVGQNKLAEVYVVGQLHVDLLELTELPDIALSNRQGYRSDDPRYEAVREYIRKELLPDILRRREIWVGLRNAHRNAQKQLELRANEAKLKIVVDEFRQKAANEAAREIQQIDHSLSISTIENAISASINAHTPDLGIKAIVDQQKKRILISQTFSDKPLADVIYNMLVFNNVPEEDILYTNCDDEIARIPEGKSVYEYLREFFVQSYSTQNIYVLFVTSENSKVSWGAVSEVGAAWITQVDHKIFNVAPFRPEPPLDDSAVWHTTHRAEPKSGDLWMIPLNADIFCQKIEAVCDSLKYSKRTRSENLAHLETLIDIKRN